MNFKKGIPIIILVLTITMSSVFSVVSLIALQKTIQPAKNHQQTANEIVFEDIRSEEQPLIWETHEDRKYGFSFKYPPKSSMERRDDLHYQLIRLQNYSKDDESLGFLPGEYYLEIFIFDYYMGHASWQPCQQALLNPQKVHLGEVVGYKGYSLESNGTRLVLCVERPDTAFFIQGAEYDKKAPLLDSILNSFNFYYSEEYARRILQSSIEFPETSLVAEEFVQYPVIVNIDKQSNSLLIETTKGFYLKCQRCLIRNTMFELIAPVLRKEYVLPEDYCSNSETIFDNGYYSVLLKEFEFSYGGNSYNIREFFRDSCGTAGADNYYEIENLTTGNRVAGFSADNGFILLGFGKNILIIARDSYVFYHQEGGRDSAFCYQTIFLSESVSESSQETFCYNNNLLEYSYPNGPYLSLVFSDGNLYLKVEEQVHFSLVSATDPLLAMIFTIGLPKYYLISSSSPEIIKIKKFLFQDWYSLQAIERERAIKMIDWSPKPEVSLGNEWLEELIKKTIYYELAEQSNLAWEKFDQDFAELSQKYPLKYPAGLTSNDVLAFKNQIQEKVRDYYK